MSPKIYLRVRCRHQKSHIWPASHMFPTPDLERLFDQKSYILEFCPNHQNFPASLTAAPLCFLFSNRSWKEGTKIFKISKKNIKNWRGSNSNPNLHFFYCTCCTDFIVRIVRITVSTILYQFFKN